MRSHEKKKFLTEYQMFYNFFWNLFQPNSHFLPEWESGSPSLSWGFLLGWIAGDLTSFTGCYFTNQLPIQIVTAGFYVNMDLIVISQFAYHKLKNQKVTKMQPQPEEFLHLLGAWSSVWHCPLSAEEPGAEHGNPKK